MLKFGFFNSLNHDRVYDAEDMSAIFNNIITDGVFDNYGKIFATRAASNGLDIIVGSGRAWFDSTWTISDSDITLTVDAADVSLSRIDSVILEVDHSTGVRANSIKILKGTPASTPVAPTLMHGPDVFQHALANITLAPGTTEITDSMIEILVGQSGCPFVTSVLESVAIDDLFAKWENDFSTWFADLQAQLSGDIATNLQNQIDELERKVDDNWENTLSNATKEILSIPIDSTPDDAFCKLALGIGKYGYAFFVNLWDGTPVVGAEISGVLAPNGATLITDENGECVGVSENQAISISVISPWVDVKSKSLSVVSTGILTSVRITLDAISPYVLLRDSGKYLLSPKVKTFDICAVGGGGGTADYVGSGGGGGGYAMNVLNATANNEFLNITVGSGGSQSMNGGVTSVTRNGTVLVTANGGKGAIDRTGGAGNGAGGNYTYDGKSATVYLFDDSSLGLAGGGGGGGGDNNNMTASRAYGGAPNGGNGGWRDAQQKLRKAEDGKAPGGGGGGENDYNKGRIGGDGGVYLRFHYE